MLTNPQIPQVTHVPQVIYKKRSFLSTLALGLSAFIVTVTLTTAVVLLYGMNIVDRKTGDVFDLAETAVRGLPELQKSLPPVLADVLNDRRQPDYVKQLEVTAKLVPAPHHRGSFRSAIELRNNGVEVVSLLSMRVVVLNGSNVPVAEWTEWGATPITADHSWRGPLLPGATRRFATRMTRFPDRDTPHEAFRIEVEITEIRLWRTERNEDTRARPAAMKI